MSKRIALITIFLVLIIDQALKIWVKTNMMLGEEFIIIENWFRIHFVENNGMAFGMQIAGDWGKKILSISRVIAISAIGIYLITLIRKKRHAGFIFAMALIFAGALGNLIDSLFYGVIFSDSYYHIAELFPKDGGYSSFLHGKVVDMFYFPLIKGTFPSWVPFMSGKEFLFFQPVFNIADSAISIGVAILLIWQRKFFKK